MANFYNRFLQSAERWPSAIAVEMQHSSASTNHTHSDGMERYTYSELRRMADSVGQWLTQGRVPAGSRIAILAANSPRWIAPMLAVETFPQFAYLVGIGHLVEPDCLERDRPVDSGIEPLINHTHGALADWPEDFVAAEMIHGRGFHNGD